eukprot:scaffold28924_cov146-Isochrysis_galbana.AAC.4
MGHAMHRLMLQSLGGGLRSLVQLVGRTSLRPRHGSRYGATHIGRPQHHSGATWIIDCIGQSLRGHAWPLACWLCPHSTLAHGVLLAGGGPQHMLCRTIEVSGSAAPCKHFGAQL